MLKWYIFIDMNQELKWKTSKKQKCSKKLIDVSAGPWIGSENFYFLEHLQTASSS